MADPAAPREADMADVLRFLTFRAGGQLYAMAAERVREVVRPPALVRVPLGPRALLGLGNLRGVVLPVAGLAELMGQEPQAGNEGRRVIVLEGRAPLGLMVDEVKTLVRIPAARIGGAEAGLSAKAGEALTGVFRSDAGEPVKVLDLETLLGRAFASVASVQGTRGIAGAPARRQDAASEAPETVDEETLIVFRVTDQEFSLPLAHVLEVLPATNEAMVLPSAETAVEGMIDLRGGLLSLLSLRALLGLSGNADNSRPMIVVVAVSGAKVGLLVDGVEEIMRVARSALELVPPVIAARSQGEAKIQSVIKADGGRRLIGVLAADQLFREDIMMRLQKQTGVPDPGGRKAAEERVFIVFRLDGQEYGIAISAVEEVARMPEQTTRLPHAPDFLLGVVNLRGAVLPIIDQRRRFGLAPLPTGDGRRLVVARIDGRLAGFVVDSVSEVMRTPADAVAQAPDVADGSRVLEGVLNLEQSGRMILLLDPSELLNRTEKGLLDALGRAEAQSGDQGPGR